MTRTPLLLLLLSACAAEPGYYPDDHLDQTCVDSLVERPAVDLSGAETTWVVDSITLPLTATQASQYGTNVDCDEQNRPDNSIGQVLATLASMWGSDDVNAVLAEYVADARLLHLITLRATSTTDADGAGFTVRHGIDVDGDPSDNFSGTEAFAIDEGRGRGTVTGRFIDGRLRARGGQVPFGIAMPYLDEVLIVPVEYASVDAEIVDGKLVGRIGGGITTEAVDIILMPVFQYIVERIIDRDCTGVATQASRCGCVGSGDLLVDYLDEEPDRPGDDQDGDCAVYTDELRRNSLVSSFLYPDVDLLDADGNLDPRADGVKDHNSIGIGFTAVPAQLAP
jgi:hypothetical protein